LSFVKCAALLARLGIDVTAGALCQAAQSTGTALVPVHAEIVRRINDSAAVVMDETGWRVRGHSAWLWVATTPEATGYTSPMAVASTRPATWSVTTTTG
jgi:transposase